MNQQAARIIPVNAGTSARALNVPLPDPGLGKPAPQRTKPRTPLSLVTSTPRRGRNQLMGIFFMVIVAALSVVLITSISVSKGQYELVGLKNQQADLNKANQTMEQEIAAKAAPQELVAQAVALGMVPAGTTGQVDIRTKTVSGSPQPAPSDTKGLVSIPPALIDKPHESAPVEQKPAVPLSPAANTLQGDTANKDQGKPQEQAKDLQEAPAPAAAPAPLTPDLNGGTIPAPAQRDS